MDYLSWTNEQDQNAKNVIYVFLKLDQKSGFKFDVEKVGKDLAQIKT